MPDFDAMILTGVDGGMLSEDRYYGLLRFTTSNQPLVIALPSESLVELGLLTLSLAPAPQASTFGRATVEALEVEWWTIGKTDDGSMVLTFELENGGQIAFRLGQSAVQPFQEAVTAATGTMPPTSGSAH